MRGKNFILQEVIDELVNSQVSLLGPLMKISYFARLIKNEALVEYTTNEIRGYEGAVPEYRKAAAKLEVKIQAHVHRHIREIPISMLEEPLNLEFRYIDIRDGIATIEQMAKDKIENKSPTFFREIPMELLHLIQPAVTKLLKSDVRLSAEGARLIGNSNIFIEIPNSIRVKLLEFIMRIADEFGYEIEIEKFNKETSNNQTINNFMSTIITNNGDGNLVNTGANNNINLTSTIMKGDLDRLKSELSKQGIDQEDIGELVEIVVSESPTEEKKLGEKTKNWILRIMEKSLDGVGKIATSASGNLLATLIKGYYGIN